MAVLSLEQGSDPGLGRVQFAFQHGDTGLFGFGLFLKLDQAGLGFVAHRHFVRPGGSLVATDNIAGMR